MKHRMLSSFIAVLGIEENPIETGNPDMPFVFVKIWALLVSFINFPHEDVLASTLYLLLGDD